MSHRRYTVTVEPRGGRWQARVYLEGEGGTSRRFATGVLIGADKWVSKREATRVAEERAAHLAREASLSVVVDDDTSIDAVAERMLAQKTADAKRPRAIDGLAFNIDKHVKPFFHAERDVRTIPPPRFRSPRRDELVDDGDGFEVHASRARPAARDGRHGATRRDG